MLKFLLSDFKKLSLILVIFFIILISLFFLAFLAVILIPLAALFLIYRKFFLKKTFFVRIRSIENKLLKVIYIFAFFKIAKSFPL